MSKKSTSEIIIQWKHRDIDSKNTFTAILLPDQKISHLKEDIAEKIGIPEEFIDVYDEKTKKLLSNTQRVTQLHGKTVCITTDPTKKDEKKVILRVFDTLNPTKNFVINLPKDESIEILKEEIIKKAGLQFNRDEQYLSLYRVKHEEGKVDEIEELFDASLLEMFDFPLLSPIYFIQRVIPDERVRLLIGRGKINITIKYNQKDIPLNGIDQQETMLDLKNKIVNACNKSVGQNVLTVETLSFTYNAKIYDTNEYDAMKIYTKIFRSPSEISVAKKAK